MTLSFEKSYDLVVAGGGIAGVSAAVEAARAGLRVAMVEKTIFSGGLATTGLVNVYLPLCDGCGTQVIFGLGEELLVNSISLGPGDPGDGWRDGEPKAGHKRYQAVFSPAAFILTLDELLTRSGVDVWFDTLACLPAMEGHTVVGLEVENKSGRGLLRAPCTIDATGDADIAHRAGAECATETNTLSIWAIGAKQPETPSNPPRPADFIDYPRCRRREPGASGPPPEFDATRGSGVTQFTLQSRALLRERYQALHRDGASRHDVFALTLPAMACFRRTRRIVGRATLDTGQANTPFADSIGLAPDWREPGPVWEIPYATLVPQHVKGLLTAGRCISSAGDAWEITRVIPTAAVTGQAAGIACALAVRRNTTPEAIEAGAIQAELGRKGIPYRLDAVYNGRR